ncbi:DUF3549 family protein [Alteromonas lipotrueiana]|uniref:DUF3549 family protein n=1 Tax=Alteromonas lipotrueiana TaxID=2803815 RepID=UPI001C4914B1|nr:DUF3549 family protein [Alteromonas lipotrueiana]
MSAQTIESISEFLLHAGTNFQVVDMGRGLVPISAQTFLDIENGVAVVPRPRQEHAWFAVVFWNTQDRPAKEYIWFLKLPVDEQGLLVCAARNHFLQIIVDALGNSLAQDTEQADKLPDNPYNFVPAQSQMAHFTALTKHLLNKPVTSGTDEVISYIRHPAVVDWQLLSVQAIADTAYRLDTDQLDATLVQHFDMYAEDFQQTLLSALDNISLPARLQQFLLTRLEQNWEQQNNKTVLLATLRAVSSAKPDSQLQAVLAPVLTSEHTDIDTLSVVAARHYNQLNDALMLAFFERAALLDNNQHYQGALFQGFFADLVRLPELRDRALTLLRTPERSEILATAIGALFSATRS